MRTTAIRAYACIGVSFILCSVRVSAAHDVLDPRKLPLGDGKVSSTPQRGTIYTCNTRFPESGAGAMRAGSWIHGNTWDATAKISVLGDVAWPDAAFSLSVANGERKVTGNSLPVRHHTGTFPIDRDDPAYVYDRNPNRIRSQQLSFTLPLNPHPATNAQCVPMGMIGVALSGVAIFNALDAGGRDAVAHEVQDRCNGHPQREGQYHYHGPTSCIPEASARNALLGYAIDGFGIYSIYDENGKELTNADLDECHGRTSRVLWNGAETTIYHYVLTREYPYTVGCFRGTPVRTAQTGSTQRNGDAQDDGRPRGGPPDDGGQRGPPQGDGSRRGPPSINDSQRGVPRDNDGPPRGGPPQGDGRQPNGATENDNRARGGLPDGGNRGRSDSEGPPSNGNGDMQQDGPPRPPPEAINACAGRNENAACQFRSPRGDSIAGTCRSPRGALACIPERR